MLLAAGDTSRAAAREQLMTWGERNNVAVIAQESGDPAAVVFDARITSYNVCYTKLLRTSTLSETEDLIMHADELLATRQRGVREQLRELTDLRGKNQNVIEYMMRKVRLEKEEFEDGLKKYYAVRSVFTNLTNNLLGHLGLDALRDETRRTREAMLESTFSRGLRQAMTSFFDHLRDNLHKSSEEVGEISGMLSAMYKRFSVEHGLKLTPPAGFSTLRYEREINQLQKSFDQQLNTTLALVTTEKHRNNFV